MTEQSKPKGGSPERPAGHRTDGGVAPGVGGTGALAPGQRWSATRKREVVLRILRGEPLDGLARELGIELYRLESWRDKAFTGIDVSLRERGGDSLKEELDAAMKRVGELTMENELLRMRVDHTGPFLKRRFRR